VVDEQVASFGPGGRLTGILTVPTSGVRATAVLLLNAGVVHHVGPQRLWVTLARQLAGAGFHVLRFDHAGLGDSLHRDDGRPFEQSSLSDVADAMAWVERSTTCRLFALVGLCAGTLTAFRVAQADPRITSLVLLTALLEDPASVPEAVVAEAMDRRVGRSYVTQKAVSGEAWRRLLTGQVSAGRVLRTLGRTARPPAREGALLRPGTEAALDGLQAVLRRGTSVVFLFAEPTTVLEYFRMTIEPRLPALQDAGRVSLSVLKGADHTFTTLRDQNRALETVSRWLEAECS